MTDAPATKRYPVLVLSDRPQFQDRLISNLAAKEGGPGLLRSLGFSAQQAMSHAQALSMLGESTAEGHHRFLFIDGRLARTFKRRQLDELLRASPLQAGLVVLGVTDNADEIAHLGKTLGITFTISLDDLPRRVAAQIQAATKVMRERLATPAPAAQPAAEPRKVVERIFVNPDRGLLPGGGVIVVHATKGGTGKTTMSSNLAYGLSNIQRDPNRPTAGVCLIDLNPDGHHTDRHFGWRLDSMFDSPDEILRAHSLTTLIELHRTRDSLALDRDLLDRVILQDVIENLDLIVGIGEQTDWQRLQAWIAKTPNFLNEMVAALRKGQWYDYLVIDSGTNRYTRPGQVGVDAADVFVLVVDAKSKHNVAAEVEPMKRLMDPDFRTSVNLDRATRVLLVNQLQDPREEPEAPRFDEVRKAFDFFEPAATVAIHESRAFRYAESKDRPLLALADRTDEFGAAIAEVKAFVNTIARVYGDGDDAASGRRPGLRLPGLRR